MRQLEERDASEILNECMMRYARHKTGGLTHPTGGQHPNQVKSPRLAATAVAKALSVASHPLLVGFIARFQPGPNQIAEQQAVQTGSFR